MEVPNVDRTEYQLMDIDEDSGAVSVLDGGDTKDDLNLPTDPSGAREDLCADLLAAFNDGKEVTVTVMKAMDQEKIIAFNAKG